jgi:hypothetical protein
MESRSFRYREKSVALRQQDENQTSNECPGRDPHVRPHNVSFEERPRGRDRSQRAAIKIGRQLKSSMRVLDGQLLV